ncbi:hypothetical protein BDA99DRAFT_555250 [Phascolomyces articulosus]|uniref:Rad21/Rec8-like protein N-terminal domain-containing protein n=1 Tax=Phascolomyces articulosus TaxID=60185 RepID=A0AAD5KST0_9FUNG|nr:hypothetical protein BDA99DRAFT_555250 [Phascolomyces articulosus]
MKLPESRKKYAATLTPRAKRLSKREIAAVDVANICRDMLDETKDPITFPVIAALLLGAAKVLQQQSRMIYSDVLNLWSRLRPKLFESKATDSIDLPTSVAKMKKITLTELESMVDQPLSTMENYYPFVDLFDWTYVSPSFSSLSSTSVNDSISVASYISNRGQQQQQQEDKLSLQNYQQVYDYEDMDAYSFGEEQLNRMNDEYLLLPLFLEGEHRNEENNNNGSSRIHSPDLDMPVFGGGGEPATEGQQQQLANQDISIANLLIDDVDAEDRGNNHFGDNNDAQILVSIMDDQRRLLRDPFLSPLHQQTAGSRSHRSSSFAEQLGNKNPQQQYDNVANDEYFDYGDSDSPTHNGNLFASSPLHLSPHVSSRVTDDLSGLVPVTQENSDNEEETAAAAAGEQEQQQRPRRRRTVIYRLVSDSTTIVPASFYRQQESLVNRMNPHSDAMLTFTSSEIELERARHNQQTNNDDRASVPSSMDDLLNPLSSTSGVDHHRFQTSRERSGSSELLLWGSSDDEEQRRSLLSRTAINQPPFHQPPEFSRVPEDDYDYMDDYMDYSPGDGGGGNYYNDDDGDEMVFQGNDLDGTDAAKMLVHDEVDADGFLSYAQWKIAQVGGDESVISLETLLSPIAHRSEVAQTFYHLLVLASRNKLQLQQENALGTIQVYLGVPIDMVNAVTTTSSHHTVEDTE